ncbi:MAG: DUF3617 domain-containing protein [Hydrogenophaga sp.]|uniref:DUF3617 domain-containing protein n=1 Tax=Hydrogenophaga sp. TaxID=1904254 RepID=UPI001BC39FF1|nr:DUF3617 domain-containing protein [Hydrogenophaga sp.]MBS3911012.1 DUF3617 domain-containing protein [Hydrogenophaga sp.]MDO9149416.1 DUF3617 domain-containing protein [Hydrogenophaga sp.]MDO9602966.1 DUF3617 domain-containing protein [Hydrogenophaga sp.]MDP2166367.1 DUF3617 domain-containing protein [Hydrogenophaga sp.]MDP3475751.1 DUF3617 domain-containing protein [Hydrogenophaga sp.]
MLKTATLCTALLVCATAASAQSIKPGLWEIHQKMGGSPPMDQAMTEMHKQMAQLPPAQRKHMEAMLGQQGMTLPQAGAGGGMVMKVCITPEMAARSDLPSPTEGECTNSVASRSGNTLNMRFVCKNPPSNGEGTYTFSGDTAYSMKMVMNTTRQGKAETVTLDGQGKWLSGDCRAVKPGKVPGQ